MQTTSGEFGHESIGNSKVITISNDILTHHQMGVTDQNGPLANLTVKFHLDESGNVQVKSAIKLVIYCRLMHRLYC